MTLTALSSWLVIGMLFSLVVLLLWIWHATIHEGTHRAVQYDGLEVFDDTP